MRVRASILVLLLLLLSPALAGAHLLTVIAPGGEVPVVRIDLGTGSQPRLVHATLVSATDGLRLTLHPKADRPLELLLLVPDLSPERDASGEALPQAVLEGLGKQPTAVDRVHEDSVTGIGYRVVGQFDLDRSDLPDVSDRIDLVVRRGAKPTRVAVLVREPRSAFVADDPERTPRTLVQLRAWAETPADGSLQVSQTPPAERDPRAAWFGGAIALIGLGVAAWWVLSGRTRARVRGAERRNDRG